MSPLRDYEFQNSLQQFALNFLYLSVFAFSYVVDYKDS